jgi:hypothetical protein
MGDTQIKGPGAPPPPEAPTKFELFMDRINAVFSEEHIAHAVQILRFGLKIWNVAVKLSPAFVGIKTDADRRRNGEVVNLFNEFLNP